jgi:peptide deformylase
MAILKIARMGHPVLRRRADPVADPTDPEIHRLIADMAETLADIGGAGLAAPQVHVPLRVVIFQVPEHRLSGRPEDQAQQELGWEGCLSVPGLKGAVPRYSRIRYRGLAPDGGAIDRSVEGFHARVVQHECDHLDGVLYPQRMTDMRLLMFVEEGARFPIDLTPVPA